MNVGSFVCMCQKTKTHRSQTEKLTSPRAAGTAGFRGSVMLRLCLHLLLSLVSLMALTLAVSTLMAARQPRQLWVCIPPASFPSACTSCPGCDFHSTPLGTTHS